MTLEEWDALDEIFQLGPDGRYALSFTATAGTHADVPGCPGLTVDLDDLWRQVDRLERS
jgi:hypothetical protein